MAQEQPLPPIPRPRGDRTAAWAALRSHVAGGAHAIDARAALAADPGRFAAFSQQAPYLFADLSKNRIDAATEALLLQLARECGVEQHRDAMFAGAHINSTEDRAVMHWLLRTPADAALPAALSGALTEVHTTLAAMLAYAEQARADAAITDVVHIGIGGSDLGP
ncbi:MAG TPA: glucose-6-phosphate isomerase, partial [Burkholderiaceae bacterium]